MHARGSVRLTWVPLLECSLGSCLLVVRDEQHSHMLVRMYNLSSPRVPILPSSLANRPRCPIMQLDHWSISEHRKEKLGMVHMLQVGSAAAVHTHIQMDGQI